MPTVSAYGPDSPNPARAPLSPLLRTEAVPVEFRDSLLPEDIDVLELVDSANCAIIAADVQRGGVPKESLHALPETRLDRSFVRSYFADIEKTLLSLSGVAGNAGHSVIKGSAREYFVKEFLSSHISPQWNVGSGEIIHCETQIPDKRNQIDALVYNGKFPQFEYSPGCSAFLIEGVSAFIEVKTKLTKALLKAAIKNTRRIKEYPRNVIQKINPYGLVRNPRPYSFLVAFDGCEIRTLVKWLNEAHEELGISFNELETTAPRERYHYNNPSIDGVFILNRGYAHLDSAPFTIGIEYKESHPDYIWQCGQEDTLMLLWVYVNTVNNLLAWNQFEMENYLPEVSALITRDGVD